MDSENLKSVISIWKNVNNVEERSSLKTDQINDLLTSIFSPGLYYYFILNFFDLNFEYVHPTVQEIIGCTPENFNFNLIFDLMHPEDAANIRLKESAATEFFYSRIPPEKIPLYKSSYTFRIANGKGGWKNILHQSIALQVADNGKIHYVLSVHSDITFLNLMPDDKISFIGINGEPSYFALSTNPSNFLEPETNLAISRREKQIIRLLMDGLSSKQIAAELNISQHTIDTHRRNLLKKTDTKNTLELAALCLRRGII